MTPMRSLRRLVPPIRSEHPDWSQPEWVDFAIRYFAATGAAPI